MSDTSQGPGWWQASDGKWYPPAEREQPGPGWWLASDGNWYPPEQRMPVKPVAKPAAADRPAKRPSSADLGTPAGPAVAPAAPPAAAPPTKPTKQATPAPSAPAASTAKPFGAPVKPAAAAPKGPDAEPAVSPGAPKPAPDSRPTLSGGLSPDLQIRVRNEQSRRDAAVLFAARKSAASRALGNISALIEEEQAAAREPVSSEPARPAAGPTPTAPPEPAAPPPGRATLTAPKSKGKLGRVAKAGRFGSDAAHDLPPAASDRRPPVDDKPPTVIADPPPVSSEPPLLEVKQGTLAADIEHIGERLVIFNDRVELHDRSDRVRQVIAGADIADVVVHKRFTGSTVTVESGTGESIVAKGLKPEQADEIRAVILKRTRAGVAAGQAPAPAPRPAPDRSRAEPREPIVDARDPRPAPSPAEAAELVAKLVDLHGAGVLTDAELAEKKALVERLVGGETLAVSTPSR